MEHPYRHADIDEEADHIVGDLDEGSGGEGGVDIQFFESQRHEGAEDCSEDYDGEKGCRYSPDQSILSRRCDGDI